MKVTPKKVHLKEADIKKAIAQYVEPIMGKVDPNTVTLGSRNGTQYYTKVEGN